MVHVVVEQDFDDLDYHNNGQQNLANNIVTLSLTCESDPKKTLGTRRFAMHDANLDEVLSGQVPLGSLFGNGKHSGKPIGEEVTDTAGSTTRRSSARRSTGNGARKPSSRPDSATRAYNGRIRDWAETQPEWKGTVSASGRLPNNLIEAYRQANPDDQGPNATPAADITPADPVQEPVGQTGEWSGQPTEFTGV